MAFVIPVIAAVMAPTALSIAAAALSVVGFVSGNKTLSMLGGLIGIGSAFAGGLAGAAGAAEGAAGAVAAGADSTVALEAGLAAYSGPDYAQAIQSGADATQLSQSAASVAGETVGNAALVDQGGMAVNPGSDLPGSLPPQTLAEAAQNAPSSISPNDTLSGRGGVLNSVAPDFEAGMAYNGPEQALNPTGADLPTLEGGVGPSVDLGKAMPGDGMFSKFFDWFNSQGDVTKAGIIKTLGEGAAGAVKSLAPNANLKFVELQKQRFAAEEAEAARRRANANNITGVNVNMRPNPNANLYPNGQYRPVGIMQVRG